MPQTSSRANAQEGTSVHIFRTSGPDACVSELYEPQYVDLLDGRLRVFSYLRLERNKFLVEQWLAKEFRNQRAPVLAWCAAGVPVYREVAHAHALSGS